jgi:glycosyltransferase involved in cell wall biosynthesis
MKILRLIPSVDPRLGGPIEGISRVTPRLASLGIEAEIACADDPKADWLDGIGVPVHALGPGVMKYGYSSRFAPWIKANRDRFDAIVVHGLWQYHSLAALRGCGQTPYVLYPHGMLDPWFNTTYPLKHLKKAVYWKLFEARVVARAASVVFTSEEERVRARESFQPYAARETVVSYGTSGPDISASEARAAFFEGFPEVAGKKFLLFLGRIHVKKGVDILLRAYAAVADQDPDLHLVICGPASPKELQELKALSRQLRIESRVVWTGMLQGAAKWGAFFSADAFCLPSHQENFGISVAEALSCGVPVLISNKVNIWREIEASNAGLVGNDDVAGTTSVLHLWIQKPSDARQRMRKAALRCFKENFHIDAAADSLLKVLNAATGRLK